MRKPALEKLLSGHGVVGAYLFGSQAKAGVAFLEGRTPEIQKNADLDLGVVFRELPSAPFDEYAELYSDLALFFEPFDPDLVFLQETSMLLQYEAICGELIYCGDEFFLGDYEEMVLRKASDLSVKKVQFEEDFLEALRNGYFEIARR